MAIVNIFTDRVDNFNSETEKRLRSELFSDEKQKADEDWITYLVEEISEGLDISYDDALFLVNCGAFKKYRAGKEYRVKKKDVEQKKKIITSALTYRDKKTISVMELSRILGLGKTSTYRLVNKCCFKSYVVCGVLRVDIESFEEWYAGQFHYIKVDKERPGKKYGKTFCPSTLGKILNVSKTTGHDLLNNGLIEYIIVDGKRRVLEDSFWKWYNNQDKYTMIKSIQEVEGYVD